MAAACPPSFPIKLLEVSLKQPRQTGAALTSGLYPFALHPRTHA